MFTKYHKIPFGKESDIFVDGAPLPQTKNQSGGFNPPQGTKVQP